VEKPAVPDNVQLRHHDYLISIGDIQPGQTVTQTLTLDNDSGFLARGRAIHLTPPTTVWNQALLVNYFDRFTGPDLDYFSDAPTRFYNENAQFGQFGEFLPIRQPVYYPPGGAIQVQATNNGATVMNSVEVYFRGSKVFRPGVLPCVGYPPGSISGLPFLFPASVNLALSQNILNSFIQAKPDSDFVIRAISIGCFAEYGGEPAQQLGYVQLYIQLKDAWGKVYSNAPVHADTCFGSLGSIGEGYSSAGISCGPYHPPLLLPEIYLAANNLLYYDLYRSDAAYVDLNPVQAYLLFQGMKVFAMGGN
jgi:hypothetical protein